MQHWDRGISGILQRVSTPVEQGCEIDSCHGRVMRNEQNLFPMFLLLP